MRSTRFKISRGFSRNPIMGLGSRGKIADVFRRAAIVGRFDIPTATVLVLVRSELRCRLLLCHAANCSG